MIRAPRPEDLAPGSAPARRALRYADARARVLGAVSVLPAETVALGAALGRALREAIRAPHDLPPFPNSSMDGFAVRAADLASASAGHPVELPVTAVVAAGALPERPLGRGEAWRIMTGAPIPDGADAVVPLEDVDAIEPEPGRSRAPAGARDTATGTASPAGAPAGSRVRFTRVPAARANIREAGADLSAGDPVLAAGRELSAHDLGLLAALGVARISVGVRPAAAILSTGDELLDVDAPLRPGAIRDSNTLVLRLLLEQAGCRVSLAERLPDDPARVADRIRHAFAAADVTLTIGGVSMGDFDPVRQAIAELKGVEWWRVAMKPGQPQAFGAPGGRLYFGLPGNPASVACVFEALVRPAVRALQGFATLDRPKLTVRAASAIESRAARTDFVRATLEQRDGAWWASPAGAQASGHLTPQSRAHALLVIPEGAAGLAAGEEAEAWLLRWPWPEGA